MSHFSARCRWALLIGLAATCLSLQQLSADDTAVDPRLRPDTPAEQGSDEVSSVFKDMGVIQKKAMNKFHKTIFSGYFGMDFSDGPLSMYSVNTDLGYGINDFFEVYLNFVPVFINSKRPIVEKVESLTLANGDKASITSAAPSMQYGLEVLWAPLYGKDSLGMRKIIRSDTFLKAGIMMIKYSEGSGIKLQLGVGKTYFIGKTLGLRVAALFNRMETIVEGNKGFSNALMIESGLVAYLF